MNNDIDIFIRSIVWRSAGCFPYYADIVYLTEKGRLGVIKGASEERWRRYVEKYKIKYWTYLGDIQV